MPDEKLALYFGRRDSSGHVLHGWTSRWTEPPGFPWKPGYMDGEFLRQNKVRDEVTGRVFWTVGGSAGLWFAFMWWDRSGDSRPNSCSSFYVPGPDVLSPDDVVAEASKAFAYACEKWPDIVTRQAKPLTLMISSYIGEYDGR